MLSVVQAVVVVCGKNFSCADFHGAQRLVCCAGTDGFANFVANVSCGVFLDVESFVFPEIFHAKGLIAIASDVGNRNFAYGVLAVCVVDEQLAVRVGDAAHADCADAAVDGAVECTAADDLQDADPCAGDWFFGLLVTNGELHLVITFGDAAGK